MNNTTHMVNPAGSLGYACELYGILPNIAESNVDRGESCPNCFLLWDDCDCEQEEGNLKLRGNV